MAIKLFIITSALLLNSCLFNSNKKEDAFNSNIIWQIERDRSQFHTSIVDNENNIYMNTWYWAEQYSIFEKLNSKGEQLWSIRFVDKQIYDIKHVNMKEFVIFGNTSQSPSSMTMQDSSRYWRINYSGQIIYENIYHVNYPEQGFPAVRPDINLKIKAFDLVNDSLYILIGDNYNISSIYTADIMGNLTHISDVDLYSASYSIDKTGENEFRITSTGQILYINIDGDTLQIIENEFLDKISYTTRYWINDNLYIFEKNKIYKLDKNFELEWERTYEKYGELTMIVESFTPGEFYIVGTLSDTREIHSYSSIIKIDDSGNVLWKKLNKVQPQYIDNESFYGRYYGLKKTSDKMYLLSENKPFSNIEYLYKINLDAI